MIWREGDEGGEDWKQTEGEEEGDQARDKKKTASCPHLAVVDAAAGRRSAGQREGQQTRFGLGARRGQGGIGQGWVRMGADGPMVGGHSQWQRRAVNG